MPDAALVIVPIRSFDDPMTRLAGVLTPAERSALARRLAAGVVDVAARAGTDGWHVAVVTDDDDVAAWARRRDVQVLSPGVRGLNESVGAARDLVAERFARVAVVHADLAAPAQLLDVLGATDSRAPAVTAVSDRHGDGTNALIVPTSVPFVFAYGPGSFERHRNEAERLGLPFHAADAPELGADVDTPADLDRYRKMGTN